MLAIYDTFSIERLEIYKSHTIWPLETFRPESTELFISMSKKDKPTKTRMVSHALWRDFTDGQFLFETGLEIPGGRELAIRLKEISIHKTSDSRVIRMTPFFTALYMHMPARKIHPVEAEAIIRRLDDTPRFGDITLYYSGPEIHYYGDLPSGTTFGEAAMTLTDWIDRAFPDKRFSQPWRPKLDMREHKEYFLKPPADYGHGQGVWAKYSEVLLYKRGHLDFPTIEMMARSRDNEKGIEVWKRFP